MTPQIRFQGFTENWEQRKLSDLIIEYKETVDSDCTLPVLTSSKTEGVVLQEEHFGRVQNHDITGYNILPRNYCTYRNRSDGVDFTFNINRCCDKGIISKFYPVFYGNNSDIFFISMVLNYCDEVVHEIAYTCTGTGQKVLSFLDLQKMNIRVPSHDEQKKISQYFEQLDSLITLHQRKCDETRELKKYMLQKMFPKNGEKVPEIRFSGFTDDWEQRKFGELLNETRNKTTVEDEDTLLSCAIDGMYLNSELFSHFRGSSNIGYLKIKKNDLILSAQNLHLGNCNVNLRFEHGIISPAYKVYELVKCDPLFMQAWVKQDTTKVFFLRASTEGASVCRKNIVWEELYKQTLPVPTIAEQEKIGLFFDELDTLITLHQRKCDELKEIKQYMLQNMFPQKG